MISLKISNRLKLIADLVPKNTRVVDVGCDHALLDIYLTLKFNCECVATDVNQNALDIAINNIKKYNLENKIKTILSDGVDDVLLNRDDCIVLSGMGTKTILDILSSRSIENQYILIQSNTDIELLRKSMFKNGYYVVDEDVVVEKKKFYPTILYCKGKEKCNLSNFIIGSKIINKSSGKIYCLYLINYYGILLSKTPQKYILKRIHLKRIILKLKKTLSNA